LTDFLSIISNAGKGAAAGLALGPIGAIAGGLIGAIAPEILGTLAPNLLGSNGEAVAKTVVAAVAAATGVEQPTQADVNALSPAQQAILQAQLAQIAVQAEGQRLAAQKVQLDDALAQFETQAADAANARGTMIQARGANANGALIISSLIIAALSGLVLYLLFGPDELAPAKMTFAMMIVTALITGFSRVESFWLGSSVGSRDQVQALADSVPQGVARTLAASVPPQIAALLASQAARLATPVLESVEALVERDPTKLPQPGMAGAE